MKMTLGSGGSLSGIGGGKHMTVDEAVARLEAFGRAMGNSENLMAALMAGGLLLENRWKELVRERFYETGTYMRSIHMEPGAQREGFAEVLLGTDIVDDPYPFYGEFGTVNMAARPTARPAIDEQGNAAWEAFVSALDTIAEQML